MNDNERVAKRAGGDQTVHSRANRQAGATRRPEQRHRLLECDVAERRFDDGKGPHGFVSGSHAAGRGMIGSKT